MGAESVPELEAALLRRVADGDERAIAKLYDRLSPLAYGLSLRITRDPRLAQDALQETFLRVWTRAARFDPARGRARAWVLRIARNASIDQLRSEEALGRAETRALASAEHDELPAEGPDRAIDAERRAAALREALGHLPREQRRVIEIAYFEGLSHTEIASREGIPLGTVKTRIRDGMTRLRNLAGEGGIDV